MRSTSGVQWKQAGLRCAGTAGVTGEKNGTKTHCILRKCVLQWFWGMWSWSCVEVAVKTRGFLWTRNIVSYGVPRSVAETLRVNQPILFSGRIRHVGLFLGTICNALEIDQATLKVQ
jgi:hypothetical protein